MRRCMTCHQPISPAREAALPNATTCVSCSTEQPVKGFMTWEHKTAPVFQVVTPRQHAWLQSRDRKGMRSGLPMSSRTPATIGVNTSAVRRIPPVIYATSASLTPRARCGHPERPQVGPSGHCVECAAKYYDRQRALWTRT